MRAMASPPSCFLPHAPRRRCAGALLVAIALAAPVGAAITRDAVVELNAVVQTNSPVVTLYWNSAPHTTNYLVYRRDVGAASWGPPVANPAPNMTSYVDSSAVSGQAYEYLVRRSLSNLFNPAYGTIVAGCNIPLLEDRGRVILLVDNTMLLSLGPEIDRLESDLAGDGWEVVRTNMARMAIDPASTNAAHYAPRLAELEAARAVVQTNYAADPARTRSVFLLGRIPVPYSGYIVPDGHIPDHYGAWPADSYYGDTDGVWSDGGSSNIGASDRRNWNVPGDGKFSHSTIPSSLELSVGRVDLSSMTSVPLGVSEEAKLRQYLNRDHDFRHLRGPYASVPRRALIDDHFGYRSGGGEAFAASGWRNGFTFFGRASTNVAALDWFTTLGTNQYLLAYGCGGGSHTSASGIGTSTYDFALRDSQAVFTMLFGSYFGDWDRANNFLRSPLAGTSGSLGLTCAWSGRGFFHFDHMAVGETVGYGHRLTQNDNRTLASGGWEGGSYARYVHYNLMGDPTLRLHPVPVPARPSARAVAGGVDLSWQVPAGGPVAGYHVYRATSSAGSFARLTGVPATATDPLGSPIAATSFSDTNAVGGVTYTYLIKSARLETSASGTYGNLSQGAAVTILADAALDPPTAPTGLAVAATSATGRQLTWEDNATNETGYEVQRRDPATGNWSTIDTPGVDATGYLDNASPANQVAHYRVRALGAAANSPYCLAVAEGGTPGLIRMDPDSLIVDKTVGSAPVAALRFNGSVGQVGMTCTIANITATNGIDYTASTTNLVWDHGELGHRTNFVPVANLPGPQLTKVFRAQLGAPTGGAAGTTLATNYVFIADATSQSVPAPWSAGTVGTLLNPGYSEHVSGQFGSLCRSGDIGGTSDNCRYIYQPISGDVQITCRVAAFPQTSVSTAKAGLLVRSNLTENVPAFATVIEAGRTARRTFRLTTGGTADEATTRSGLAFPCWLRVTRTGNAFESHWSTNGSAWNALGTATSIAGIGPNPLVGLVLTSDNTTGHDVPACARFDSVGFVTPPSAPAPLTAGQGAVAGHIALGWSTVADATGYHIERSTNAGGPFAEIAVVDHPALSHDDGGLDPTVTYFYRARAHNGVFFSDYTATAHSVPAPPNLLDWRTEHFGSSANAGPGANGANPDFDLFWNLLEYAFRHNPLVADAGGPLIVGTAPAGGLRVEFDRDPLRDDIDLIVECSDDLLGWTTVATSTAGGAIQSVHADWSAAETGSPYPRVTITQDAAQAPKFVRVRVVER